MPTKPIIPTGVISSHSSVSGAAKAVAVVYGRDSGKIISSEEATAFVKSAGDEIPTIVSVK